MAPTSEMSGVELDEHLSAITTAWSLIRQAHDSAVDAAGAARAEVLRQYSRPAYRYLLACVGNTDAADDLFQEFALRFVAGAFQSADPQRGRFRDLLKTVLYRLAMDHHRRRRRLTEALPPGSAEPVTPDPAAESDKRFLMLWRAELMERAWEGLGRLEAQTGQPFHRVLRLRADRPELRSADMAQRLSADLGRQVSADWVRKRLQLAREKFTDLLVALVADSLAEPTDAALEQELSDLELLEHCRTALERRRGGTPP